MSNATAQKITMQQAIEMIEALTLRVQALEEANKPKSTSTKEMSDDDARSIMFGEHANLKHKEAAEKLGLTYGQIYSCRLGFTFKAIHQEMKAKNIANPWMKA